MSKVTDTTGDQSAEKPELPVWFNEKTHHAGTGGIFETATGTLLADDGEPQSEALRIQRRLAKQAAAAEAKTKASAAATGAAASPKE